MLHTIYAANGIVSNAFTGPGANEIIPNEYLARLLEKRNEEVMLEYFFFAIVFAVDHRFYHFWSPKLCCPMEWMHV